MTKASALQAALSAKAGKTAPAERPEAQTAAPAAVPTRQAQVRPSSREGKVNISAYLDPAYKRGLRMVQAINDRSLEELLAEALNDLFAKHNVPQVRQE